MLRRWSSKVGVQGKLRGTFRGGGISGCGMARNAGLTSGWIGIAMGADNGADDIAALEHSRQDGTVSVERVRTTASE